MHISSFLEKLKVCCHIHMYPPLDPKLRQLNLVHIFTLSCVKSTLILSQVFTMFSKVMSCVRIPEKNLRSFVFLSTDATAFSLFFFYLTIITTFWSRRKIISGFMGCLLLKCPPFLLTSTSKDVHV